MITKNDMIIYHEPFPKISEKIASVALGTFDGVHIGHRAVIKEAVSHAREGGGAAAVWCFSAPPKQFFSAEPTQMICSTEEKINLIAALGVDTLIMPTLDEELFAMPPEEFLFELYRSLSPSRIVVGFNYRFGAGAAGTPEMLCEYFEPRGVAVTVVPAVITADGTPVSSTLIRSLIEQNKSVSHLIGK